MKLSVVIPTYNDFEVLDKCLQHLNNQSFDEDFEVVVVDDGSTDKTQDVLNQWGKKKSKFKLKTIYQKNKKQGVARNRGVVESGGDTIIFIGSDILVQENWLNEHKKFHDRFGNDKAIGLGFMTWSPELANDRFRQWLESSGTMLSYKGLKNYEETDFWHFYTGNISMKKSFFEQYKFDEDFKAYGWEDIMLGYRMLKDGAKLYYIENAKAWHDHALTEKDLFPGRMREIGKSAVLFFEKFPDLNIIPKGIKLFLFKILSLDFVVCFLKVLKKEWGWYAKSKKYFLEGVKNKYL